MTAQTVTVSDSFRAQALRAILSVVLFVLVFFLLIALAIGLMITCVSWALAIVIVSPGLITLLLGIGLASLGFLVLFFLLKFLFKTHKIDRSHLVEIKREDEPTLFSLIDEIVQEVGTTFPKRIYLSADVNAAVFYDSNFWSMFLPIKKNLQIGLGLVNTVTTEEFKGILAHEFGHFSQRSMKVGSYVYNVNQIIHNMLYDNEGFDHLIQRWASANWAFAIFVMIAVKIVQAIQWVLAKLYHLINLSYLSLSREMEFHADEIAAHTTGSAPLGQSLLRIEMAQQAFNEVLQFYHHNTPSGTHSANLYPEQQYALHFLAQENKVPIVGGLPQPAGDDLHQFTKSKLVIDNQWASHPSTADRVAALTRLSIPVPKPMPAPANELFQHLHNHQEQLTRQLFPLHSQEEENNILPLEEFVPEFDAYLAANRFHPLYNGYFDQRNPALVKLNQSPEPLTLTLTDLLSENKVALANEQATLINDLQLLTHIVAGETAIKTFDYDGRKYKQREFKALIVSLKQRREALQEALKKNDQALYWTFQRLAQEKGAESTLRSYYQTYYDFDAQLNQELEIYHTISQHLQFTNQVTPLAQIKANFAHLKPYEQVLKEKIQHLLADDFYQKFLTPSTVEHFHQYLAKEWRYFGTESYFAESLNVLFLTLEYYQQAIFQAHFQYRKRLLDYQASLVS